MAIALWDDPAVFWDSATVTWDGGGVAPPAPSQAFGGGIMGGGRKKKRLRELERIREEEELEDAVIVSLMYSHYLE